MRHSSRSLASVRPPLRRHLSFVQDFQIAMREAMPATKDTDTEEISSSIDEEGGAEDIPRELNALIKNL